MLISNSKGKSRTFFARGLIILGLACMCVKFLDFIKIKKHLFVCRLCIGYPVLHNIQLGRVSPSYGSHTPLKF